MYLIAKKINIGRKASVVKNNFISNEIVKSAPMEFRCCKCCHENTIEIVPYETGFPIFQIYKEDKVLSESELLKKEMVFKTFGNYMHFGELTVNNLPTLYFGTDCSSCDSKYICIFSYGEKQPGMEVLTVSGVWEYKDAE